MSEILDKAYGEALALIELCGELIKNSQNELETAIRNEAGLDVICIFRQRVYEYEQYLSYLETAVKTSEENPTSDILSNELLAYFKKELFLTCIRHTESSMALFNV